MEKVCRVQLTEEEFDILLNSSSCINRSVFVSSVIAAAPDILSPLSLILENVLQADQQMMERTKAKLFSALISVLQIQGLNGKKRMRFLFAALFKSNVQSFISFS